MHARTRSLGSVFALLLALAGCSSASPADLGESSARDRYVGGKADGDLSVREAGPLEFGERYARAADETLEVRRVESFGGTKLSVSLDVPEGMEGLIVVEGPIDDSSSRRPDEVASFVAERGTRAVTGEVELSAPGVYQVVSGAFVSQGARIDDASRLTLTSACDAVCTRPSISNRQLLEGLRQSGKLEAVLGQADAMIAQLVDDENTRAALSAQLRAIVASPTFEGIERFPTLPLAQVDEARLALGVLESQPVAPPQTVRGELSALLGACDLPRTMPAPIRPEVPEVLYDHFPNGALTACEFAHSKRLADVLTSLAANNGSEVTYRGERYSTPRGLFEALAATGHTIEVRNERSYANFISLATGDMDVRWPVWLDTGVEIERGESLVVPVGHSHHAWRVSGPDVDARVMFYLGPGTVGFYGQTSVRPAWTGLLAAYKIANDSQEAETVFSTLDAASAYQRRIAAERTTVAAGMPSGGYGYLGVCNDSNAVIEYVTRGTVTTFPLMRAAELDEEAELGDGLDDALRALPHDADDTLSRADVFSRVLAMTPHALDSSLFFDETLRGQLLAVSASLQSSAR